MKKSTLLAIAVSLNAAFSASAGERPLELAPGLLAGLHTWLDAETEFAPRDGEPRIMLIEAEEAEELRGVADRSGDKTRGLYDEATETIYLTVPWSAENPRDVSVLVHELTHHRQAARFWYCPQAQEWRAYQIQSQWLGEQGIEDDFYWPAILLQSSCAKRDIHPD